MKKCTCVLTMRDPACPRHYSKPEAPTIMQCNTCNATWNSSNIRPCKCEFKEYCVCPKAVETRAPGYWARDLHGETHVIEYATFEKLERELAYSKDDVRMRDDLLTQERTKSAALVEALTYALGKFNSALDEQEQWFAKCANGAQYVREALAKYKNS